MAFVSRSRKSGFINRGGVARRESLWLFWDTSESTLSGAPTAVLTNQLNAAALALRPFTIVRTRGIFFARSDQLVANESYIGDLGFAVVSDQASAIGVTAVPTPLTDKGSDLFFVYEQIHGRIQVASGAGTGVPTNLGLMRTFDSKAMRKVEGDQDVISTVENEIQGCVVTLSARMLIKLH